MSQLNTLLENDGIIMLSTLLSDGNIKQNHRLTWCMHRQETGILVFSHETA